MQADSASCIFSAGIHVSQQVFPERKTLRVLTKDWSKFKNSRKVDTQPASALNVNRQTGEHCRCCRLSHMKLPFPQQDMPQTCFSIAHRPTTAYRLFFFFSLHFPFCLQGFLAAPALGLLERETEHSFKMNLLSKEHPLFRWPSVFVQA